MLFHYTSAEGLIGIVRDKCLWATSAFYLNDSQELLGGIELARSQLQELRKDANTAERDRIDWLLHDIRLLGTAQSMDAYVCSLSTEPDLLSQWRAYCRGGGFAIGFPVDHLRDHVAKKKFALRECYYLNEHHAELIQKAIEQTAMAWIRSGHGPVTNDEGRFVVSGKLSWELVRAAAQLKSASFSEEHEFRIVSSPERAYDPNQIFFRARGGMIIPYTKIELPDTTDFWGRVKIIIGPTPHREASKASVYQLVRRYHGHAVAIDLTATPYREW